jgi:NAD(P)-dependent dehydrogenase (short-subunit alcohol dehydrogenase family)
MTGKVVLITGGNSGIGKASAIELARLGGTVVITARNAKRGERAVAEIRAQSGRRNVHWIHLDLADFASICACAAEVLERFDRLDVLINNAGHLQSERTETKDGFESTFGVNHLGHFLLTKLLLDRLRSSAPARVINVASTAHWFVPFGLDFDDLQSERRYDGFIAYARSKLANIQFTRELARRCAGSGVTSNSLCPGLVASNFARDGDASGLWAMVAQLSRPLAISPSLAARTSVFLASDASVDSITGEHFVWNMRVPVSWVARDARSMRRLWEVSEELVRGRTI